MVTAVFTHSSMLPSSGRIFHGATVPNPILGIPTPQLSVTTLTFDDGLPQQHDILAFELIGGKKNI